MSETMNADSEKSPRSRRPLQFFLGTICVCLAAFWVYALFFASKQGVNVLEDKAWTVRAEEICKNANLERDKLIDLRRIDSVNGNALSERADIIDKATVIVQKMLNDVTAQVPNDVEDAKLSSRWREIYQSWINARIDYTAVLRTGENAPFAESMLEGSPESDYINDFTTNNRMTSCAAPMDLAV
ncbi:unannotated protein [freshwater metagenome]|uniref:Unannotated protein n=1 Tax=freshwater metagenome TaxID=449393 RepID=A0A6J7CNA5_9ZZZZ